MHHRCPLFWIRIIRRRPEIKWNRKEEDIKDLIQIQRRILNNAKHYIKPGGRIIYSTCTINPDENINLINEFVGENRELKLIGFEELLSCNEKMNS